MHGSVRRRAALCQASSFGWEQAIPWLLGSTRSHRDETFKEHLAVRFDLLAFPPYHSRSTVMVFSIDDLRGSFAVMLIKERVVFCSGCPELV